MLSRSPKRRSSLGQPWLCRASKEGPDNRGTMSCGRVAVLIALSPKLSGG